MKTIRQIADEIGVSKQAVFKKIKREPLSTSLQGFTATVDGRLMVSVDGEKLIKQAFSGGEVSTTDNQLPPTESDEKTVEVDGQNALYEILKMELQAKNEQIAALQAELSKERQHSQKQAEKIAVLADQAQKLQLAQMSPQLMDGGGAGLSGSALAGAVPAPGRKGAGAATCARGAAAGKRAGTGPHLGRYGAVKEACPGALQEPPGQAIITVKIGNKMY